MSEKNLPTANEPEEISGIFISEHQLNNMTMERIVVSDPAIKAILKITRLSVEAQEDAVFKLIDRTPEWLDLDPEVQMDKIKTVLTLETVLAYLQEKGIIRDLVDTVEIGIDIEGSIVVYAYYTNLNREQRRRIMKSLSEDKKKAMIEAVNIFGSNDKLIDLAAKKLERLKKEGKTFRGRKLK